MRDHTILFQYTGDAERDSEKLILEVEKATIRERATEAAFAEYLRDLAALLTERAELIE